MKLKDYLDFMRDNDLYIMGYENDIINGVYYIHYMVNVQMWTEIIYKKDLKDDKKMEEYKDRLLKSIKPFL